MTQRENDIVSPGLTFFFIRSKPHIRHGNVAFDEEGNYFDTTVPWTIVGQVRIENSTRDFVAPINYLLLGPGPTLVWYQGLHLGMIRRVSA